MIEKMKFFLASSSELAQERDQVELIIQRRNHSLINRHMYFEVVRWEELLQSYGFNGVQNHFSSKIPECQVMIVLFHKKVGEFTKEEFDIAYKNFKTGLNPRFIFVYFKESGLSFSDLSPEIMKIVEMRGQIKEDKQMFINFRNLSELSYSLYRQLDHLTEWFENSLQKFTISKASYLSEVAKMPKTLNEANEILNKDQIRNLVETIGLFESHTKNPHLAFEEGDISYYFERNMPRVQLEAELRAKKLVLDKADKVDLHINEPGDLSEKSKPVKLDLVNIWQTQFEK